VPAFEFEHLKETFDKFGKYVVQQARTNLTKKKKNVSKKLYDSIGYESKPSQSGASFSFEFFMEDYGEFQDKGVSGIKKKYNTPYSYKNKKPPIGPLDKWIVRKGFKDIRDEKGRFIKRRSLAFAIQNKIYRDGIKPSHFFSRAFALGYRRMPQDIRKAFKLDVEQFMKFTLKDIFN
jgi:hypothetical protein